MSTAPNPAWNEPLRSEFADDPEMKELVEMFLDDLPDRVASVQSAWRERHLDDLRRLAHQLKGASPGYGFPAIGSAAALLERELNSLAGDPGDRELQTITQRVDELIRLCARATR